MLSGMNQVQKRRSNWLVVSAVVLLAGGVSASGQQRQVGGPAGDLAVDFIVVGANGQPVADLQPGDVSIKIAGKQRTISALEMKRVEASSGGGGGSAPAPFATNAASTGRSLMIIVDNDSLRAGSERKIRENVEGILKDYGGSDRVGFAFLPRDTAQLALGSPIAAVRDVMTKFTASRPATVSTADALCRTRDTLQGLRNLLEGQAGSDKPVTVLFFSSGLSLPSRSASSAGQSCEVTTDHYQAISAALANARGNLYVIQGDETQTGRDDGLETLAGTTNAGSVLRTTGPALSRVQSEGAAYYVATVKADPADRAGQLQKLEVKVNRDGVTTRARTDVAVMRGGATGGGKASSVTDMVRTTANFTELQLRTTAVAARGPAGKMTVLSMTEPVDPGVKFKELMVAVIDTSVTPNKIVFPSKADEKQLLARPVIIPLSTDPGKYRVRVAAIDETGKAGAVDYDLVSDLTTAGPLKMGGLMLAGPRGQGYAPQLVFSNEEDIAASIELYGDLGQGKLGAKLDIAASVDGPSLAEGQIGGQGTSEKDRFILNGKIPIAKLPPGDYVVRAIVQIEGQPEGRVYKTMRKVAK